MNEYIQAYRYLQKADVIVLQEIERKLYEIFAYCKENELDIHVVMDYDFDLRFIVSKTKSNYIRLNGGEINLFLPYCDICNVGKEKNFSDDLTMLFTKIKAINGIDDYIRNITQPVNDVLESEPPDCPPIPIPPDDFF